MRLFEIVDARKRFSAEPCGLLAFHEENREFEIRISPHAGTEEVPMLFIPFIERGELLIPPEWARVWVQERIPPLGRQNIAEILIANGLEEYDELTLLLAGDGRCSQDEFMVREVSLVKEGPSDIFEYAYVRFDPPAVSNLKANVGATIAEARKLRHMSQAELADSTGISQAKICRIERGEANPTLETLGLLARGLHLDWDVQLS